LRHGLDVKQDQQPRLDHVRRVLSLSYDLGPRLIVVAAGAIPEEPDSERGRLLSESFDALARYGDRIGAGLAFETGLESGNSLASFIKRFDTGALGANLDPANLLMHDIDPYESTRALHGLVRHVHARDARQTSPNRQAQETPLGRGDVDWMQFLGTLEEVEYRGWITVVRDSGQDRLADISNGIALLCRLLP
jgi:sugar phosphate isomerase/epimerase